MGEDRLKAVLFGSLCQAVVGAFAVAACVAMSSGVRAEELAADAEAAAPAGAGALLAADATKTPPPIDARAAAVTQTVRDILSYTRWPVPPKPLRLCVLGATEYADHLLLPAAPPTPDAGPAWQVIRLPLASDRVSAGCDVAYIGAVSDKQWQELLPRLIGRPILTICEQRNPCEAGGMFCLDVRADGVSFTVNLDSMARSTVRVHPNVLKLGQRKGKPA